MFYIFIFLYCNYVLVCLYFNENVYREIEIGKYGKFCYRVLCLKFKFGEEVVCEVVVLFIYGKFYVVNYKIEKVLIM